MVLVVATLVSAYPAIRPSVLLAQCSDGSPPPCQRSAAPSRVTIDSNAVAILPFRVSGAPADVQWLREGMVDLLNIALDGAAGWRVVHASTVVRAIGGEAPGDPNQAIRTARTLGAEWVVLGSVIALGPELRLQAELYDATRDRRLGAVVAIGDLSRPAPAVDSVASGLVKLRLVMRPGGARRSLEQYSTASPAALRAYLVAEQLERQARWQEATDSLLGAVARDSSFALAYYALGKTAIWGNASTPWDELEIQRRAMLQLDRLPERQRGLLLLWNARLQGRREEMFRRANELAARYPDDAEIALLQGDIYFHEGMLLGEPPQRALEMLQRTMRLDSTMLEPQGHVVELLFQLGDTANAWQVLRRLRTRAPQYDYASALEIVLRCALRGERPATVLATVPGLGGGLNELLSFFLRVLTNEPGRAVAFADSFASLGLGPNAPGAARLISLQHQYVDRLAQGRYAAAWETLQRAAALAPGDREVLASTLVYGFVTGAHVTEARAAAQRFAVDDTTLPAWTAALVAWRAAVDDDSSVFESAARQLVHREARRPAYAQAQVAGLRGLLALGRGDSVLARQLLTTAHEVRPLSPWNEAPHAPDIWLSLTLARLERSAGDRSSAERRRDEALLPQGLPYRAQFEELRGQIAEAQGDTATAIQAYRNFIALWQNADPELQPRVAAAREALARLE